MQQIKGHYFSNKVRLLSVTAFFGKFLTVQFFSISGNIFGRIRSSQYNILNIYYKNPSSSLNVVYDPDNKQKTKIRTANSSTETAKLAVLFPFAACSQEPNPTYLVFLHFKTMLGERTFQQQVIYTFRLTNFQNTSKYIYIFHSIHIKV